VWCRVAVDKQQLVALDKWVVFGRDHYHYYSLPALENLEKEYPVSLLVEWLRQADTPSTRDTDYRPSLVGIRRPVE
jgi:hypothetical protein